MSKSRVILSIVATCCLLTAIIVPCAILIPNNENSKLIYVLLSKLELMTYDYLNLPQQNYKVCLSMLQNINMFHFFPQDVKEMNYNQKT